MADDTRTQQTCLKIFCNLHLLLDYFEDPQDVLAREIPSKWRLVCFVLPPVEKQTMSLRDEVRKAVEQRIEGDPALRSFRAAYMKNRKRLNLEQMADMISHHPKLRAEYFAGPDRMLARRIPENWYRRVWRWARGVPLSLEATALRVRLATQVEERISKDPRLVSARETYYERESFLKQAMQNPERSFHAVFWMSIAAFVVGLLLIGGAFAAAVLFEDTTQKAVLAGLSGGAGVITTLVAVFQACSREIRTTNGDNAQLRIILTDFASEITHLRGVGIKGFEQAIQRNAEIRRLTRESVSLIATQAMPSENGDRAQTGAEEGGKEQRGGAGSAVRGFLQRVAPSQRVGLPVR